MSFTSQLRIQDIMDLANIATTMRYVHATDPGKLRAIKAAARGRNKIPATNLPQTAKATKAGRL